MTDEKTKPSRHWNDQPGSHDRERVDLSSHIRSFWLLQCFAHREQRPPPKSLPFSCDPLGQMFPRLILSWWRSEFMWKRLVPASSLQPVWDVWGHYGFKLFCPPLPLYFSLDSNCTHAGSCLIFSHRALSFCVSSFTTSHLCCSDWIVSIDLSSYYIFTDCVLRS